MTGKSNTFEIQGKGEARQLRAGAPRFESPCWAVGTKTTLRDQVSEFSPSRAGGGDTRL